MKKRKKWRSKTEGGDKLPFDTEMGKNQKAIKVLQRLFDAGYGTEKEIVNMTMDEMLALPGVNSNLFFIFIGQCSKIDFHFIFADNNFKCRNQLHAFVGFTR